MHALLTNKKLLTLSHWVPVSAQNAQNEHVLTQIVVVLTQIVVLTPNAVCPCTKCINISQISLMPSENNVSIPNN